MRVPAVIRVASLAANAGRTDGRRAAADPMPAMKWRREIGGMDANPVFRLMLGKQVASLRGYLGGENMEVTQISLTERKLGGI
jgi:hypothetical protein